MEGRYQLYGHIAAEHEPGNADLPVGEQRVESAVVVYATDDKFEAKRLVQVEGGFIKNDKWHVVVGAVDTQSSTYIGEVPASARAGMGAESE